MRREIREKTVLDEFCESFCKVVERHCPYIIVSGFVAISSGRTRGTEDIDMIIPKISESQYLTLHKDLENHGFECMQGTDAKLLYKDYLNDKTSIRYTRKNQLLPEMEVKLSKDELDDYQIQTRVKIGVNP